MWGCERMGSGRVGGWGCEARDRGVRDWGCERLGMWEDGGVRGWGCGRMGM